MPRPAAPGALVVVLVLTALAGCAHRGRGRSASDEARAERAALVYVALEDAGELAVVDAGSDTLAARVAMTRGPRGWKRPSLAASGDLLVRRGRNGASVEVVDLPTGEPLARVPTCPGTAGVALSPDEGLAFAACEEGAGLALVDLRALRPAGFLPLGPRTRPRDLLVSRDGRRLYVANGGAGSVTVVDLGERQVLATLPLPGTRPAGLALAPDGRKLYVAGGPSGEVAVIDTATLEVVSRIPLGGRGRELAASPPARPLPAR